jgi:hypothetical protein
LIARWLVLVLVFPIKTCQKSQFLLGSFEHSYFWFIFALDACSFECVFGVEREKGVIIADVTVNWAVEGFLEFGLLTLKFIKVFEL